MSDIKQKVLSKIIRGESPEMGLGVQAQEDSAAEKLMKILDMPGRATRAAIGAYQKGMPLVEAAKQQFDFQAPEAPSGAELAEHVRDKYEVESPAALAAMATAAEVVDPTMLIPGGQVSKLGKLGAISKIGKKQKNAAELLREAKDKGFGKTVIAPSKADLEMDAMKKAAQRRVAAKEVAKRAEAGDLSEFEKRLKKFQENKSKK